MRGDLRGVERVYRRRRRLPWLQLVLTVVIGVNAYFQAGRLDDPYASHVGPSGWAPLTVGLLMTVGVVRIGLEQVRAYTRVTADGVTVQGRLRARSWGWQDVYDIRVEPAHRSSGSLGPRWFAYLYDNDGRRHLLWHVDDWQLDDPYAEVSELRGPSWEPRPAVEGLILRGWARRRAWTRAMYGGLGVLVVMFFVDFGRVVEGRPAHSFLLLVCVPVVCFGVLGAVLQRIWTSPPPAHV